jgi:uncharacterized DUF497 family protein
VQVTWDEDKARENIRKHDVSFAEAKLAMADPLARLSPDHDHSEDEDRFTLIAQSTWGRILIITFTPRGNDSARIISARRASAAERRNYMDEKHRDIISDRDVPSDDGIMIEKPLPESGWVPNPFRFGPFNGPFHALINAGVSDAFRDDEEVNEALWFLLEQDHYARFQEWREARAAARKLAAGK